MHLSASDLVSLHRPTLCPLRVYLRSQGVPEAEPGAFDLVLRDLGQQHERAHLATLGPYEDISLAPAEEQEQRTKEAIEKRSPVIYQGRLSGMVQLNGETATIVGRPDFLVLHGDEYLIRDAKLSRRVDEDNHPEISLQLQLYGWLYRNAVGRSAAGLQAYTGKKDIAEVADDGGRAALLELGKLLELRRATDEPYEPLGWTKCAGGCGFYERCWSLAEARQDVSLVMDVDQGLARKLHGEGVISARDLLARYDAKQLSELRRPWGKGEQKVGKKAEKVLIYAEVLCDNKERRLGPVVIPEHENYVMFDLEGMPPYSDELEKVYLWGMQVYGRRPGEFLGVTAGFGADGDREGWTNFLKTVKTVFDEHGDIPFVHWHHYERTHIQQYVTRYGDVDATAERILSNLMDLLPLTRAAIALPLPSYSLKVVEGYVGFQRTQDEYGGDWAMAQFILATETDDEAERNRRMGEILKYNEEDLAATWAVFEWLRAKQTR